MDTTSTRRSGRITATGIVLIFSAVVVFTGFQLYRDEMQSVRHYHADNLQSIAMMKVQLIRNWRSERLDDAQMNSTGILRVLLNEMIAYGGTEAPQMAMLLDRMQFFVEHENLKNMMLADAEGKLLVAVNPDMKSIPEDVGPLIAKVIETGEVIFDGINLCSIDKTIHVDVGAPVLNRDGKRIGILILRSDPKEWLFPLLEIWPGESRSAETILTWIDGGQFVIQCNLTYRSDAPLSLKKPIDSCDLIRQFIQNGKDGIYEGLDYRNTPVLVDIRGIPESDWVLVTKMDLDEIYGEAKSRSMMIGLGCLGVIALFLVGAVLVLQGIERRELQQNLREERLRRKASEEIRAAFYGIGDGIITTDIEGKVVRMNPVAETLTGWTEAEAIGKPLKEVFHIRNETTRQPVENPVIEVLRKGVIVGLANHTILVGRDSTERPIADSGAPIRDEDGNMTGVVLVFRDQTKEREYLKALQWNEARLRAIFDAVADPIVVYDADGITQYINPAFTRLFGWYLEEIIGNRLLWIPEDQRDNFHKKRMEMFKTGAAQKFETQRITKEGKKLDIMASYAPFFDVDKKPLGAVACLTDITRIKEMEREIRQAQKMEAIGALAAGIAHDFNNILFPISGLAQISLWDAPQGSALQQNLEKIYDATRRAADLVQQILSFSRRAEMKKTPVLLQPIVKEVFKLTRSTIPADIEMRIDVEPEPIRVMADATQLHQVLMNLITNAYHAVENSGGSIQVELMKANIETDQPIGGPKLPAGQYALIRISDTGCGIHPTILDKIFEPYFTTKPNDKGTGLGLAVVNGIVTELGGDIRCESWLNNGTVFHVYLPLLIRQEDVMQETLRKHVNVTGGTERILLVDDEEKIIDMERRLLERLGYTVGAFLDSEEALQHFIADPNRYDLVIADMSMPKMKGEELAKRMLAVRPEIPIVICTGYTDLITEEKAKTIGIYGLAPKPLALEKLAKLIRQAIDQKTAMTIDVHEIPDVTPHAADRHS